MKFGLRWRKSLSKILCFVAFAVILLSSSIPAEAQGGFTTVTGTIKDPSGITWACGTISAQLITAGGAAPTLNGGGFTTQTSPVQLGCPTIPGSGASGSFVMRLADSGVISPSNTTWRFTVGTTGTPPPLGTGPQSFSYTTAINCSTNTPTTCTSNQLDISTPISALAPAIGAGGVSNNVSTNPRVSINVKAPPYNAKGDTQQISNATVLTIAAGTGGCPTGGGSCVDIPSSANAPFVASDIGKILYGNEAGAGLNRIVPTVITGVFVGTGAHTGEQMITLAISPGGCGGGCNIIWGTDDQAAIKAAALAAYVPNCAINQGTQSYLPYCNSLYFPSGGYMFSGGGTAVPGLNAAFWGAGPVGTTPQALTSILTDGSNKTIFYIRPDYNIGTISANRGAFIAGGGEKTQGFTLTSSYYTLNNGLSTNTNGLMDFNGGIQDNQGLTVLGTGIGTGGGPVVRFAGRGEVHNLTVQNPPTGSLSALCDFTSTGILDVYGFTCSNGFNMTINNITGGTSASHLTFHGGFIDEGGGTCTNGTTATLCVTNSKDVSFFGTTLTGFGGNASISVDATSEVRCAGCSLVPFGANGGSNVIVASGGVFRVTMSKFIANLVNNFNYNCALPTSCIDDGGNNYSATNTATFLAAGSAIPYSSLTHTWNTCHLTITPIVNATTYTLCNQFLDQNLNLVHIKASSQNVTTCATAPIITISDGTNSQTLTLTSGAATWDSGVITKTFASGGTITVKYDVGALSACATPPTNLSVTYNASAYNSP